MQQLNILTQRLNSKLNCGALRQVLSHSVNLSCYSSDCLEVRLA